MGSQRCRRKTTGRRSTGAGGRQADAQHLNPTTNIEQGSVRRVAKNAAFLLHVGMYDHAVTAMHGWVWQLATDRDGTRVVQAALQQMPRHNVASVLRELHEHVLEACRCLYANYTLQRAIEVSPTCQIDFVMASLLGHEIDVACHRVGCRIFCRILEHNATQPTAHAIVSNLLDDAPKLICHGYGNHVAKSLLEHGSDTQRHILATALLRPQFIERFVLRRKVRAAQYVAEAALLYCAPLDKFKICARLMGNAAVLDQTRAGKSLLNRYNIVCGQAVFALG